MSRVDVLAWFDAVILDEETYPDARAAIEAKEARAAVAELIERTAALLQVTDPETLEWQDLLNALHRVQGKTLRRLTAEQEAKAS